MIDLEKIRGLYELSGELISLEQSIASRENEIKHLRDRLTAVDAERNAKWAEFWQKYRALSSASGTLATEQLISSNQEARREIENLHRERVDRIA